MQGLMQSYPLTLVHVFERAERLFADKAIVDRRPRRARADDLRASGRSARGGSAACSTIWGSPPTAAWARSRGTPPATWSCTSPRRAPAACCTRSTSGCSPSSCSYVADHAEDEVIFADRSLLKLLWPLIDELPSRAARRRHGRRRRRDPRRRADPRLRGAAGRRRRRSSSASRTRTAPRPCVTRAAPPATRRASSTRTARRSCTRSGTMLADTLGRQRERHDPAGRPDVPRQRVGAGQAGVMAGSIFALPGPNMSPAAIADADGGGEGHAGGGRADDLDGRHGRARRPRPVGAAADPVRRLGRPALAVGGLPREDRPPDAAGLGDDRDVSRSRSVSRIRSELRRPRRGVQGRPARHRRASSSPLVDIRIVEPETDEEQPWDGEARGELQCAGPVDRRRLLRRRRRRSSSPTTAGCAPATWR